jgi:hypothetical protein
MKRCFKCGGLKSLSEFYRHPKMADGHLGKCKACTKADVKKHYRATLPERHAYEKRRRQRPERKKQQAEQLARHNERHPDRKRARQAVANAIRDKKLTRGPCGDCGTTDGVEGHHEDYSQPLKVDWLCRKCHRIREKRAV